MENTQHAGNVQLWLVVDQQIFNTINDSISPIVLVLIKKLTLEMLVFFFLLFVFYVKIYQSSKYTKAV
jgi:hypothetical protein